MNWLCNKFQMCPLADVQLKDDKIMIIYSILENTSELNPPCCQGLEYVE